MAAESRNKSTSETLRKEPFEYEFHLCLQRLLKPLLKPGDSSTIFAITELQTANL
jgi:hypothetical protein